MPIVVRRGRAVAEPRSRLLRFERPVAGPSVATTIGSDPRGPDPRGSDPRRELARLALDLVVRTAEPIDVPYRWSTPTFGREVDRTRAHLAPIRSRTGLIGSFSREASISATREAGATPLPAGPVRVAYAIRWLELGDGRARPSWPSLIAGPVELVAGAIGRSVDPLLAGAAADRAPSAGGERRPA
jgi:hypothetical protein